MTASATNPEGLPQQCPICGANVRAWPSTPLGDAPCPRCGSLLTWFQDRFSQQLAEALGVPVAEDFEQLLTDLKADSLDMVELVMELEDEFDIAVPESDYSRMRTIGDLIRYLRDRQRGDDSGEPI